MRNVTNAVTKVSWMLRVAYATTSREKWRVVLASPMTKCVIGGKVCCCTAEHEAVQKEQKAACTTAKSVIKGPSLVAKAQPCLCSDKGADARHWGLKRHQRRKGLTCGITKVVTKHVKVAEHA